MVLRAVALIVGIVETLAPRSVVDFWLSVAVASDEPVEARDWVYTAARIEGLVLVLWALGRCRSTSTGESPETA